MLNFNSYEDLKDKLQIRIYDPDFSRNLLEGKVVTHIGDFALVYMATLYESEKKLGNLMFTPELMDALEIDIQTLHKDAMISDLNYEPVLFTTEDLIEAFALKKPLFAINLFNRKVRMRGDKLPMLTLTKGNQMNGASMILHKSIRKKIGDIVGGKKAMRVGTLATATVAAAYYVSKHPDKFSKVLKAVEKESVKNFSRKTIDSGKKYVKKCVKESANGIKDGITEGVKEAPKKAVKTVITGVTLNAAKKYLDSIVGEEESARIFRANDNKQIGKFWKTSLEDIVK